MIFYCLVVKENHRMKKSYVKHLVECHCILPQYRSSPEPLYHSFVVFSIIDENDFVVPKHAQCTNCGVIHRVIDVAKSEIVMGNESQRSIITREDIKHSLPQSVVSVLESYELDVSTWEEALFILEERLWGRHIILSKEEKEGVVSGKCLKFNAPNAFRVEPFVYRVVI